MDPDSPLPTMELRMVVPRIQHSVHMYVTAEVDKLKDQIEQKIKAATLERLDRIDDTIKQHVDNEVSTIVRFRVREAIIEAVNAPEITEALRKRVTEELRKALE